jgi:hypothetical protein
MDSLSWKQRVVCILYGTMCTVLNSAAFMLYHCISQNSWPGDVLHWHWQPGSFCAWFGERSAIACCVCSQKSVTEQQSQSSSWTPHSSISCCLPFNFSASQASMSSSAAKNPSFPTGPQHGRRWKCDSGLSWGFQLTLDLPSPVFPECRPFQPKIQTRYRGNNFCFKTEAVKSEPTTV